MVFFRSDACDLDRAEKALLGYGLQVERAGERLTATRGGAPKLTVVRVAEPFVKAEAIEIAAGSEHAAAMKNCDARFEIGIPDLDAALDEINTLMEVQGALQDASRGYLFVPWNGNLSGPWEG